MKRLFLSVLSVASLSAANAQEAKTETFKVYGNCGMCEKRIEKAAKIEGVTTADWNDETHVITVTYNPSKTTIERVHKAIAAVGHDTDKEKATDSLYQKLPGCCKYDRNTQSNKN